MLITISGSIDNLLRNHGNKKFHFNKIDIRKSKEHCHTVKLQILVKID